MRHGTVDATLRFVGQQFVNAGYPDPRKPGGGKELDLPIKNLLSRYLERDPASQHQVAVPVELVEFVSQQRQSLHSCAIADLIELQFLFLLRVGEYTMPAIENSTRTIQFSREDVTFWKNQRPLSHHEPLAELMTADCVTLTLHTRNMVRRMHVSPTSIISSASIPST